VYINIYETKTQLSLEKADRIACNRRLPPVATVNAVIYLRRPT